MNHIQLWRETPSGSYILYTEDSQLITDMKKRKELIGKFRPMAEYYLSTSHVRPFAWQFRVESSVFAKVDKMVGSALAKCSRFHAQRFRQNRFSDKVLE